MHSLQQQLIAGFNRVFIAMLVSMADLFLFIFHHPRSFQESVSTLGCNLPFSCAEQGARLPIRIVLVQCKAAADSRTVCSDVSLYPSLLFVISE